MRAVAQCKPNTYLPYKIAELSISPWKYFKRDIDKFCRYFNSGTIVLAACDLDASSVEPVVRADVCKRSLWKWIGKRLCWW